MKISEEIKTQLAFFSVILLVVLIFAFAMFGMVGIRVALGIVFITLPFYLLLRKFDLTEGEKALFSIILGITIFPSLTYLLGLLISFRIAIAVMFILLIVIVFVLNKYKSKNLR